MKQPRVYLFACRQCPMTSTRARLRKSPAAPSPRAFRWRPDQQWEGYLFLLPGLLGLLVFVFLAVGASFGISFLDWGLTGPRGFVAFGNYRELLRDPVFWRT